MTYDLLTLAGRHPYPCFVTQAIGSPDNRSTAGLRNRLCQAVTDHRHAQVNLTRAHLADTSAVASLTWIAARNPPAFTLQRGQAARRITRLPPDPPDR